MASRDSEEEWSIPKAPKRTKNIECIIHCTDSCDRLVRPESHASWKSLLNAAVIHQHSALLDVASRLTDDEIGDVVYHRRCRSKFTLKKSLAAISTEFDDTVYAADSQEGLRLSRTPGVVILLPKTCIFCNKIFKGKNKENLSKCEEKQAGESTAQVRIRNAAIAKGDQKLLQLCDNHDFLASEAHYHRTCYRNTPILQKRGTQARTRYVNISNISSILGEELSASLPGMHAFTGCDAVSAFSGKGKMSAFKLLQASMEYQRTFLQLGVSAELSQEVFKELEKFTCGLYGSKAASDINELRYAIFCAKRGKVESHQLPPCRDSLYKHAQRANHQTFIWQHCLEQYPEVPGAEEHGWKSEGDEDLFIDWVSGPPAPEAVLSLLSCECVRRCSPGDCTCIANGLRCTEMCRLKDCENAAPEYVSDDEEECSDCSESVDDENEEV